MPWSNMIKQFWIFVLLDICENAEMEPQQEMIVIGIPYEQAILLET